MTLNNKVLIFTKDKTLGKSCYELLCSFNPKVRAMLFLDFAKSYTELKKNQADLLLIDETIKASSFNETIISTTNDKGKIFYFSSHSLSNTSSQEHLNLKNKLNSIFHIKNKNTTIKEKTVEDKIQPPNILAIGASTGGPAALLDLFSHLNTNLPFPIVLVNHIPTGDFAQSLADSLTYNSKLKVHLAQHGMVLNKGEAYLCPGGQHLIIKKIKGQMKYVASLTAETPPGACIPSIDMTFESLAKLKFTHPAAIIMTGMGKDGTEGAKKLAEEEGACIYAQDPKSCLIPSMPKSIVQSELASKALSITEIAYHINKKLFSFGKKATSQRIVKTGNLDKSTFKNDKISAVANQIQTEEGLACQT